MGCKKMEMLSTIRISLNQNIILGCTFKYGTIVPFPPGESSVMQMH